MGIRHIRTQIDDLDDQILDCLNRRAVLALESGKAKRRDGQPIRDPNRESEVLERLASLSKGPLPREAVVRIFKQIIEESRKLQEAEPVEGTPSADPPRA